jgi:hypothetical protein
MGALTIPLQGVVPQSPSPISTLGQLMQIRDAGSQIALRNAQTQQAQQQATDTAAQAAERTRSLHDQATIQQAMKDPGTAYDIAAGKLDSLQGKVSPDTLFNLQKTVTAAHQAQASLTLDQHKVRDSAYGELSKTLAGLQALKKDDGTPDLDAINEALPGAIQQLSAKGVFRDAGLNSQPPTSVSDPKQLSQWEASIGALQGVNDAVLAQKKETASVNQSQAEASEKNAQAALQTAQLPGAQATSTREQLTTQLMQKALQAAQSGQHPIDAALDPALDHTANSSAHAAYDAAIASGDMKKAADIVHDAAQTATQISLANNPQLIGGAARKAAAVANAEVPAHVAQATAEEKAKAALAPGALGGIADPAIQHQVASAQIAAQNEYEGKVGDANRLNAFVDAAKSGNQAASAMIPLAEVREIVNRVNKQEVSAASGGVSALRSVENWLSSKTEGKPTDAQLNDIQTLGNLVKRSAQVTRDGKITNLNTNYGSKFPIDAPQAQPVRARDPRGNLHEAPAGTPLPPGWKLEQ